MLINLRNALMSGKRLPYDAEVEYLESTGTQYIDTGILANGNFDAKYEVMINSISSESDILAGARSATQHLNLGQSGPDIATIGYLNRYWGFGRLYTNVRYTMDVHLHSGSQYIIVNGVKQGEQSYTGTELLGMSVYIFKRHHYASDSVGGLKGRIYFFSLWQNGVLVRDYIPVRKGTVGYLYDRVTRRLFGNVGTGDFVLGPDVVPVEYIESHGTEWINSGVIGEPNIIVEAVYSWGANAFRADNCLVGSNNTSANNRFIPIISNNRKSVQIGAGDGWLFASPTILYDKNITYTARSEFVSGSVRFTLDGTTVITSGKALTSTQLNMFIFASNENGGRGRLANAKLNMMKIIKDNTLVRSFRPVRVGTEGAMMDVLTRRIYRNAGTGAFAYGNDLKYPIPAA